VSEKREAAYSAWVAGDGNVTALTSYRDYFRAGYDAALADNAERVREMEIEAELKRAENEAANAELRRRIVNQAAAHDLPRVQDVAEIYELKNALAEARATIEGVREAAERYRTAPARYKSDAADQAFECVNTVVAILWPVKT
jgi:hypothetical protein